MAATYDSENRQCNIINISKSIDYEDLKVTIVLNANGNFTKNVVFDIGTLEAGEVYTGDLSYILEDIGIDNVYIDSFEYYQNNDTLEIILVTILIILLIFLVI